MRALSASFGVLSLIACAACSSGDPDSTSEASSRVVGGQPETGYAPVGYLLNATYSATSTYCGTTLIAPNVVVTAAHCVAAATASSLSVGFGTVGSGKAVAVTAVHVHPGYVYRAEGDYLPWNDVAVLELASAVTDRAPAVIARAETGGCGHRYVGYGRDTVGGAGESSGYDSQRKSAAICADGENNHELLIHGKDGGLCWGDSGGPLLVDGTTRIVGVLSRHAPRIDSNYSCENGNRMVFTALATYREFIAAWAPNAFEAEPAPSASGVGWCNVQWPPVVHAAAFQKSDVVYGRAWISGVTGGIGQGAGVRSELGYGPTGTPLTDDAWLWFGAKFNTDADGLTPGDRANDEYMGAVFPYKAGSYDLAYRFSVDSGLTWTTCKQDGGAPASLVVAGNADGG